MSQVAGCKFGILQPVISFAGRLPETSGIGTLHGTGIHLSLPHKLRRSPLLRYMLYFQFSFGWKKVVHRSARHQKIPILRGNFEFAQLLPPLRYPRWPCFSSCCSALSIRVAYCKETPRWAAHVYSVSESLVVSLMRKACWKHKMGRLTSVRPNDSSF